MNCGYKYCTMQQKIIQTFEHKSKGGIESTRARGKEMQRERERGKLLRTALEKGNIASCYWLPT
jgi:hypothetical protein